MKLVARRFNPISRRLVAMFAVLAGFSAGACIPDFNVAATGGAGGTGVGGTGGTGGASLACEPGSEMVCYTGILGTDGLGLCTPGVQVCDETENYGPCLGSGSPKLESCSSDEDENCDGLPGCVGECIWTRRFEKRDINNGSSYAAGIGGIAVDPSWNTIVAGGFDGIASGMGSSPLDLGGGELPCSSAQCGFIAKFDPLGKHIWSQGIDGHAVEASALLSDGDLVVALGRTTALKASVCQVETGYSRPLAIVRFDADGNCKQGWGISFTAKPVFPPIVGADAAGNVYVAFAAESGKVDDVDVGGQSVLVWVDTTGTVRDVQTFGSWSTYPAALAVDPAGDVYIAGESHAPVSFGATLLPMDSQGLFVAKYSASRLESQFGPWSWAHPMWSQVGNPTAAGDMVVDAHGRLFLAGRFPTKPVLPGLGCEGTEIAEGELLLVQLGTSDGFCQKTRSFGQLGLSDAETNQYLCLRLDPDGKHLILSGSYDSASLFQGDNGEPGLPVWQANNIFVAKLDDKLQPTWARGFGRQYNELLYGLAVDWGGGIRIAGVGRGVDFGCGGAADDEGNFFLTRLSP